MDSLTLELFRRLQAGPYDESGFKHIQRLLGSQRRVLRSKQDLATLTEIAELLEAWAICAEDPRLGAVVLGEAAEIAERELRRPALANELRALPAADGGDEQERPSGAHAYAALGRSRVAAGHPGGAIEAYERALEIEAIPEFVKALADLYAQRGAEGDREQAADLYFTLGELLGPPDGLPMLKAALAQNPDHAEARTMFAEHASALAGESSASARSTLNRERDTPPPLRAPIRAAEPTPTPITQRSPHIRASVDRTSSPLDLENARHSTPGLQRASDPPDLRSLRRSSAGVERVSSPHGVAAARPGPDRISSTPGLATGRASSPGGGSPIDRLSTPPGLGAPLPRVSSPTTRPYTAQRAPTDASRPSSSLGPEGSFERQSSTHAIRGPRPTGAPGDRQSSTHVIPELRTAAPEPAGDRVSGTRLSAAPPSLSPLNSDDRSTVSGAIPPPLGRARSAKQHSTLSGGWNPSPSSPGHIRAAAGVRFDAGGAAAGVSQAPNATPSLKSTGTRARTQLASAEALSDLMPAPEDGTGPSMLEIDLSSAALADSPASSLSPVVRHEEFEDAPASARPKRFLGAGVALASACVVWLGLVLAPRGTDPASSNPTATSAPRPESSPAAPRDPTSNVAVARTAPEAANAAASDQADPTGANTNAANNATAPASATGADAPAANSNPVLSEVDARNASPANPNAASEAATTNSPSAIKASTNAANSSEAHATAPNADATNPASHDARTKPHTGPEATAATGAGQRDDGSAMAADARVAGSEATGKAAKERKPVGERAAKSGPYVEPTLELAGLRGGKINEAQLTAAIEKTSPKFDACYEIALKAKPRLHGRLGFGWTIRPNGKVANVRKLNGAIKDPNLVKCTVEAISSARFPKPRNKPAEVFLSLEFRRP